jgi:chemotaxis protein MotB
MARKIFEEEHENHERWLVSYADFITLLFAFFVVMYAISSLNEGKYRVLSNALGTAFGKAQVVTTPIIEKSLLPVPAVVVKQTAQQRQNNDLLNKEKDTLTGVARDILKALAPLVNQGKVRVTQSSRGISVEINASVLFAPGEAKLTPESLQALNAVAQILKNDPHAIQVEGHTDSVPINTLTFPSNWELSSVRASSVVRLFIADGIPETRLTAVGHGPKFPVASNDTAEGRQRNRRVEVMILARLPEPVTEVPVEKPASQ